MIAATKTKRVVVPVRELLDSRGDRPLQRAWIAECSSCDWRYANVVKCDVQDNARWHRHDHTRRAVA